MARLATKQPINLNVAVDGVVKTFAIKVDLQNEIADELLNHPYLVSLMKAGIVSIIPDTPDPVEQSEIAERVARGAREKAEAAKRLKADKEEAEAAALQAIVDSKSVKS